MSKENFRDWNPRRDINTGYVDGTGAKQVWTIGNRWNNNEIKILRKFHNIKKSELLSKIPNRTWISIGHKINRLGLKRKVIYKINKISKIDWSYLAGLFDGEGAFYIGQSKGKFRPYITITITDKKFIQDLHNLLGCGCIFLCKSKMRPKWKDAWRIDLVRKNLMEQFLINIKPFLKLKNKHAELLLQFLKTENQDKKSEIYNKIKTLQRGKRGADD